MNQWRIFRHPLQVKLENAGKVFICAARHHNVCAAERLISSCFNEIDDDNISRDPYISFDAIERVEGNAMM